AVGVGIETPMSKIWCCHILPLCRGLGFMVDLEIADQGQVVGVVDARYRKVSDVDALPIKHEIEFLAWGAARIRRQPPGIRAPQPQRFHEQINFVLPPKGVEVARDDDGLFRLDHEVVQRMQLHMSMPILQREMHEKNGAMLEFELDDEALDAFLEVVESLSMDVWRG